MGYVECILDLPPLDHGSENGQFSFSVNTFITCPQIKRRYSLPRGSHGGGSLDIRENSEKPALGEPAARTQRSCAPTLHLSTCFRCFFKSLALPARP